MSEACGVALGVLAGVALGAGFYGGLWWTVRRGVQSARPAQWFLISLVVRTGLALLGFYAVGRGDWRRLAGCLAGFLLARVMVARLTRAGTERVGPPLEGGAR